MANADGNRCICVLIHSERTSLRALVPVLLPCLGSPDLAATEYGALHLQRYVRNNVAQSKDPCIIFQQINMIILR